MAAEASAQVGPLLGRSRATAVFRRLTGQRGRRLGWGVADQAVSSLTNFAVVLYLVRVVGAAQFGAFSLAYVAYGFFLSASRGLATGPLQVRFSGTDLPTWRRAVASCTGTAAVAGLVAGACVLAAAALLGRRRQGRFPRARPDAAGLLLQDSWRYRSSRWDAAARHSSTTWSGRWPLPALVLLRVTGHEMCFGSFSSGALLPLSAAIVGPWQAKVVPRLSRARGWVRRHGDLGFRFLAESTSISGANQLRTYCSAYLWAWPLSATCRLRHADGPHHGHLFWDVSGHGPGGR